MAEEDASAGLPLDEVVVGGRTGRYAVPFELESALGTGRRVIVVVNLLNVLPEIELRQFEV